MKEQTWEEEKEKRRQEALARHAHLHKLFQEDRLAFERERKNAIQELINGVQQPQGTPDQTHRYWPW